jgi:hypothetical protein
MSDKDDYLYEEVDKDFKELIRASAGSKPEVQTAMALQMIVGELMKLRIEIRSMRRTVEQAQNQGAPD